MSSFVAFLKASVTGLAKSVLAAMFPYSTPVAEEEHHIYLFRWLNVDARKLHANSCIIDDRNSSAAVEQQDFNQPWRCGAGSLPCHPFECVADHASAPDTRSFATHQTVRAA